MNRSESELSTDTAEFEDARDELCELPPSLAISQQQQKTPRVEQSTRDSGKNTTTISQTPRRKRDLASLRRDISAEFCVDEQQRPSSSCFDDNDGASDRCSTTGSMISWRGHYTLNELISDRKRDFNVTATDSISTRASPYMPFSTFYDYPSKNEGQQQKPQLQSFGSNTIAGEVRSNGGNSSAGNSSTTINIASAAAIETTTNAVNVISQPAAFDNRPTVSFSPNSSSLLNSPSSPVGPPPSSPPPPLPPRLIDLHHQPSPTAAGLPPPLPKRTFPPLPAQPTITDVNDVATSSQSTRTQQQDNEQKTEAEKNKKSSECFLKNASLRLQQPHHNHHLGGGGGVNGGHRKRGHAKTRSLDYKYVLSQLPGGGMATSSTNSSMGGPTEGSPAKSSSLTRAAASGLASFIGGEDVEDAEERINNAQGIIRQLTKDIESEGHSWAAGERPGDETSDDEAEEELIPPNKNELDRQPFPQKLEEEDVLLVEGGGESDELDIDKGVENEENQQPKVDGYGISEAEEKITVLENKQKEEEPVEQEPKNTVKRIITPPPPLQQPQHLHHQHHITHRGQEYPHHHLEIVGEECSSVSSAQTTRTASRQCEDDEERDRLSPPPKSGRSDSDGKQSKTPRELSRTTTELVPAGAVSAAATTGTATTSTQSTPQKHQFHGRRSNSMEAPRLSRSHTKTESVDLRHRTLTNLDSIDPITRDIELKIQQQEKDGTLKRSMTETSSVSSTGTSYKLTNSVVRAKNLLKTCGASASGFIRNTLFRARAITAPRDSESEIVVNDEVSSISDSHHSPSLRPGSAVTPNPPLPSTSSGTTATAPPVPSQPQVICRPRNTKKGPFDFEHLKLVQEMNKEHTGAIWVIKFSQCGRALATAGQDCIVRVWVLREAFSHFAKKRREYTKDYPDFDGSGEDSFNTAFQDEGIHSHTFISSAGSVSTQSTSSSSVSHNKNNASGASTDESIQVFSPKPFCVFRGHTAEVVDLDWPRSNDYYLLTAGMDKTIKLWHLFFGTCLGHFTHPEPVSCVGFLPRDSRYFISGCLDGRIRIWSIHEKKVVTWTEVEQEKLITSLTFLKHGKICMVGTYSGRCFFYEPENKLKYHTTLNVRSDSVKSSQKYKISSLAHNNYDKILIASADSRVRMYDFRDMELCCKFKGAQIQKTQVRASFSPDGRHIICGSEDNYIYLWRTGLGGPPSSSIMAKNKNQDWERFRSPDGNSVVTMAVFSPKPQLILSFLEAEYQRRRTLSSMLTQHPQTAGAGNIAEQEQKNKEKPRRKLTTPSSLAIFASSAQNALASANLSELHRPRKVTTPTFMTNPRFLLTKSSTMQNLQPGQSRPGVQGGKLGVSSGAASSSNALASDRQTNGDVIVTADLNGSIKVYANPATIVNTGSSTFFNPIY